MFITLFQLMVFNYSFDIISCYHVIKKLTNRSIDKSIDDAIILNQSKMPSIDTKLKFNELMATDEEMYRIHNNNAVNHLSILITLSILLIPFIVYTIVTIFMIISILYKILMVFLFAILIFIYHTVINL